MSQGQVIKPEFAFDPAKPADEHGSFQHGA